MIPEGLLEGSRNMAMLFIVLLFTGLFLLIRLDYAKNRLRRLAERGGAAALFGVGLVGSLLNLFQP
jgi:hypothetical protein